MKTNYYVVDKHVNNLSTHPIIEHSAALLRDGEVVAFPTETVYGLGADATSTVAVERIYEAKGRPSDNPLIVHIAKQEDLHTYVDNLSEKAQKLVNVFWPGPLTLVCNWKKGTVSDRVTAGLSTIAVRMPEHPVAISLIEAAGKPLAAPSANRSGKPSPTSAQHVLEDLNGRIPAIVDGGDTGFGVESTVLDTTVDPPILLRPGGVTQEEIEQVIGEIRVDAGLATSEAPRSPGMKYTHYAPEAPVSVVEGSIEWIQQTVRDAKANGEVVGWLGTKEACKVVPADVCVETGVEGDLLSIAKNLYAGLRSFNETNVTVIFAQSYPKEGVGYAVMNRLEKAAGHKIISE